MEPIIKEIKRYIELTDMDEVAKRGYQMGLRDMLALCDVADRDTSRAVCEAFLFGKAKGYRAAKAR